MPLDRGFPPRSKTCTHGREHCTFVHHKKCSDGGCHSTSLEAERDHYSATIFAADRYTMISEADWRTRHAEHPGRVQRKVVSSSEARVEFIVCMACKEIYLVRTMVLITS